MFSVDLPTRGWMLYVQTYLGEDGRSTYKPIYRGISKDGCVNPVTAEMYYPISYLTDLKNIFMRNFGINKVLIMLWG